MSEPLPTQGRQKLEDELCQLAACYKQRKQAPFSTGPWAHNAFFKMSSHIPNLLVITKKKKREKCDHLKDKNDPDVGHLPKSLEVPIITMLHEVKVNTVE